VVISLKKLRIAVLTLFGAEIVFWIVERLAGAVTLPLEFNGFPADGPFQTFNPLRRIAAGQHAGIDFQFFHGLGVPYLLYPLYALFGKTIYSAELSREVLSVVAFALTIVAIVYAASRDKPTTIVWTAAGLALFQPVFQAVTVAANSLLGLRSTAPAIFATVLLWPARTRTRMIGCALALALALALGSEQGLSVIVAFAAMQMLLAMKSRTLRPLAEGAASVMMGVAGYLLFLVIVGGPAGCRNALRYAFKDVPGDQLWYFGSPPNTFLSRWWDVVSEPHFMSALGLTLIAAAVVLVWFWRTSSSDDERVLHAVAVLLIYGLLSGAAYLGIAFRGNVIPMLRAFLLALLALTAHVTVKYLRDGSSAVYRVVRRSIYVFVLLLGIADVWLGATDFNTLIIPRYRAYVAAGRRRRLSPRWQWDLAIAHRVLGAPAGAKPRIWSTYAGLIQSDYGVFNPSFDYIIHALGEENRRAYIDTFRRTEPEYVETMRRSLFGYEDWLRAMHWDFYSELLHHYTLVAITSHSLWWKLGRETPLVEYDAGSINMSRDGQFVALHLPRFESRLAVAVVTLKYRLTNPWARVPVIGQLPRHLVGVHGAANNGLVALSPYRTVAQIPIFVRHGQTPSIGVITESLLPGASVTVLGATVNVIEIDRATEPFLALPFPMEGVPREIRQAVYR
jgi:hypothetical protein